MVDFSKYLKKEENKMTNVADPMAFIHAQFDKAAQKAAEPKRKSTAPLVLFMSDGNNVLMRPLADFTTIKPLVVHHKWNSDPALRINAICAKEVGKECALCTQAKDDYALTPDFAWFLPVWVYQITQTKDQNGQKLPAPVVLTYKERDENGNVLKNPNGSDVEKRVSGIRLIEFSMHGAIATPFKTFCDFMEDPTNCKMTECDWSFAQNGKGKGNKAFTLISKMPRSLDPRVAKVIPPIDRIRERLFQTMSPIVASDDSTLAGGDDLYDVHPTASSPSVPQEIDDDIPEF